jgi:hypothetical protein
VNAVSFDTITRRASLISLGAVGLATFAADAKKKKSASKKAKQKCQKQAGQCMATFASLTDDPSALAQVKGCCALAGNCDIVGFYYCLTA